MAIILCVVLVFAIPLGVLLWKGSKEHKVTEREIAAVRSLSPQVAEQVARRLLSDSGKFKIETAVEPFSRHDVPKHVSALFNRYRNVVCGEFWLGVDALVEKAALPGFLKIGGDFEFVEILVRPNDERIYISYGEGPRSSATLETEETIWHEIILASGVSAQQAHARERETRARDGGRWA